MALLNAYTKVQASVSIQEISQMLAKSGASAVLHEYDQNGNIVAISFRLRLTDQPQPELSFRLPSDWRPVHALLSKQLKGNPNARPWMKTDDHARNVAWRVIKDWVEAQLAIIETNMVTSAQVFLPYAVTKDGDTLYTHFANNPSLLLGKGEA